MADTTGPSSDAPPSDPASAVELTEPTLERTLPGRDPRGVEQLIEAPSLPSWSGRTDAPEDAPTVRMAPPPMVVFQPASELVPLDPVAPTAPVAPVAEPAAPSAPTEAGPQPGPQNPTPQREPQEPREPREEKPMSSEDPRELARRLAEEAKRRLREAPSDPGPAAPRSVADRAASAAPPRAMSAKEALAAAREAERAAAAAQQQAAAQPAARPARPAPPPAPPAPAAAAAAPPRSAVANRAEPASFSMSDYGEIVRETFKDARSEGGAPVGNIEVFRALWRAHRARASHEGDVALVTSASVLLDATQRLPEGALAAGRVQIGGDVWAVWVDLAGRAVLAAARPPEVYLTA